MVQRRHLGFPTLTLILLLFPAAVATLLMLARMLSKHRQLQTIGWNNLDPSDAKTISSGFPNFDLHDFPVTNLDGRETHLRFMNIGEFILKRQKVHCLQKKHKRSVWSVCKFLLYHKTHQISREHQVGQRWKYKKRHFWVHIGPVGFGLQNFYGGNLRQVQVQWQSMVGGKCNVMKYKARAVPIQDGISYKMSLGCKLLQRCTGSLSISMTLRKGEGCKGEKCNKTGFELQIQGEVSGNVEQCFYSWLPIQVTQNQAT